MSDPSMGETVRDDARLIAALDRRQVGALQVAACAAEPEEADAAGGWWRFAGGVAVAPLTVDGAPVAAGAMQDAPAAAALLAPVEPLLAALEAVLAMALEPVGLDELPNDAAALVRIDAVGDDDATVLRLLLALPATLAMPDGAGEALPLAPAALAAVPVAWEATIAGPALAPARWATVAPGDLLLLGGGPLRATLERGQGALLDLTQGRLIVHDDVIGSTTDDVPGRLRFALAGGTVPAGRLASLTAGSVLPLPVRGATLPVAIARDDEALGTGELVAVGDGFGVIVTERHGER